MYFLSGNAETKSALELRFSTATAVFWLPTMVSVMWLVLVMVSKTVMFLYSFLFDPLSSLSSLFVLSGHKTPFAKRRCDDEAIKEGLDNEARLVRQRQISSSKDNILRSVVVSLSQRKSALPTNKILIPSFREFSDRYVNPCPRSFLPLDTDGVPRVDLASVSLHES